MLKDGKVAIRNRLATKSNRWDEQRSVEQASKDESVFESYALVVEPAVGEIAQKLFVWPNLRIWLVDLREVGL